VDANLTGSGGTATLSPDGSFDQKPDVAIVVFGETPYAAWATADGDAAALAIALVAVGDVYMHVRSRKPLQDVLTAIRVGKPLTACGLDLQANAEQHLRSRLRLAQIFPETLLAETLNLVTRCDFSLDELKYQYPQEVVPAGETPASYLRKVTYQGAGRRWPGGMSAKVQHQVEHELALIGELHYEPYFLTVYDIVSFARSRHILCQGRGSAANSAVCYCIDFIIKFHLQSCGYVNYAS